MISNSAEKPSTTGTTQRPNLIFFVTDEQSWDAVGYETPDLKTPNIDRLARNGMIFRAGHCAAIPCVPSRASFLSGMNYHRWERISDNPHEAFLKEGHWTWAHAMREGGYRTGVFGALHSLPLRANHGFDVMQMCDYWGSEKSANAGPRWRDDYYEYMREKGLDERLKPNGEQAKPNATMQSWEWPHSNDDHPISWVRDRSIEFLNQQHEEDKPFAIQISFRFPHPPYIPAEPFASMYDPESIDVPTGSWTDMEGYIPALDFDPSVGYNGLAGRPRDEEFRLQTSKYRGSVSQIDDAIGSIIQNVDLSNTLILYGVDHGDFRGRRGRIMKMPGVPFEPISRIPFFASGYGVPTGKICERPVSMIDISATFLQAAGIDRPDDLDGQPLQNYFADPAFGSDRAIYCHGSHAIAMVQCGKMKYFRTDDNKQDMLFDLESDPNEKKNLAADSKYADIKEQMVRKMDEVLNKPAPHLPRYDAQSRRIS